MNRTLEPGPQNWQELYKAAIFEIDSRRASMRIAEAERVIISRTRSLFHQSTDAISERTALDAALYALRILKIYSRSRIPTSAQDFASTISSNVRH